MSGNASIPPWLLERTRSTRRIFSSLLAQRAEVGESGRNSRTTIEEMKEKREMATVIHCHPLRPADILT